jgi:hypothetical protein
MDPAAPRPTPAPATAAATEEEAWAEVLARWGEPEAHRAYLARFPDLQGLSTAGGRYRAVLAERPDDPVAARLRDEIVKRAAVQGLAQLPRTPPPRQGRRVPGWAFALAGALLVAAAAWAALALGREILR